MKTDFGTNPFDACPSVTGRYHVVDEKGYMRSKSDRGFAAYDNAGNLSDREADVTFTVIDTRDGSEYGNYRNGKDKEERNEESDRAFLENTNPLFSASF